MDEEYTLVCICNNHNDHEYGDYTFVCLCNNDVVIRDPNNDVVIGDPNNDVVIGDPNNDVVIGDPNKDVVIGDPNKDVVIGDPNNDIAIADPNNDIAIADPNKVLKSTPISHYHPTQHNKNLNHYTDEIITFFLNSNLGIIDPLNPKSEKVTDVLKRSPFGTKNIATSITLNRLFLILVYVNNFKNITNGTYVDFPDGFLQKNLPTIYKVINKFEKCTWFQLNQLTNAGIVSNSIFTDDDMYEYAKVDIEKLLKQTLNCHRGKKIIFPFL